MRGTADDLIRRNFGFVFPREKNGYPHSPVWTVGDLGKCAFHLVIPVCHEDLIHLRFSQLANFLSDYLLEEIDASPHATNSIERIISLNQGHSPVLLYKLLFGEP